MNEQVQNQVADVRIIAVMFNMGVNTKTKEPQLKGVFYTSLGRFVTVVPSVDAENQPKENEIWVCEINIAAPVAEWTYKGTPSAMYAGNPICQIETPEKICFNDVGGEHDRLCYIVRETLPDGKTRVIFTPDFKSEHQPVRGETWKATASLLIHTVGTGDGDDTIVIGVNCTEKVVLKPISSAAQALAAAGKWTPGSSKKTLALNVDKQVAA